MWTRDKRSILRWFPSGGLAIRMHISRDRRNSRRAAVENDWIPDLQFSTTLPYRPPAVKSAIILPAATHSTGNSA